MSKVQLNLYVSQDEADRFRAHAKARGFGEKPSGFLSMLLATYEGDWEAVERAVATRLSDGGKKPRFGRNFRRSATAILSLVADELHDYEREPTHDSTDTPE